MANKVNWTKSIKKLEETGVEKIIEIGPGKVLSGLIKESQIILILYQLIIFLNLN